MYLSNGKHGKRFWQILLFRNSCVLIFFIICDNMQINFNTSYKISYWESHFIRSHKKWELSQLLQNGCEQFHTPLKYFSNEMYGKSEVWCQFFHWKRDPKRWESNGRTEIRLWYQLLWLQRQLLESQLHLPQRLLEWIHHLISLPEN